MSYKLINDDCMSAMIQMPDNSVDSIITDPPYEIGLMNRKWDSSGIAFSAEMWGECLRVAKPGTILLSFGGAKTFHRLFCAIEDAGWVLQNSMFWAYGEGMPKGIGNIGKANDMPDFDGFSTGIKPCVEPICVAMAPIDGTFAQNAERWSVAGYNVDACRIPRHSANLSRLNSDGDNGWANASGGSNNAALRASEGLPPLGGWPSNLVADESAAAAIDMQSGYAGSGASRYFNVLHDTDEILFCSKPTRAEKEIGLDHMSEVAIGDGRKKAIDNGYQRGKTLRKNPHESVKPLKIMLHLCKLTRPPAGGVVFDPFAGSGTTGVAAALSGRDFIGVDMRETCIDVARARIAYAERYLRRQGLEESTVAAMMDHQVEALQMSIFDLETSR